MQDTDARQDSDVDPDAERTHGLAHYVSSETSGEIDKCGTYAFTITVPSYSVVSKHVLERIREAGYAVERIRPTDGDISLLVRRDD